MAAAQPLLLFPEGGGPIQHLEPVRLAQEGHNEAWLRDFLLANPDTLPIRKIDHAYEGAVSICRGLPTLAGPVDGLLANASGALTILECKLWKNPEARRKVVAQILDYAREIADWRYSDLQRQVSRATGQSGNVLFERVARANPGLDEAAFVDSVSRRLRAGRFLLLIAGDGIHSGTEAIVDYMSRHSGLAFSFGLVELGAYRAPAGLLVQPRILAKTEAVRRTVVQVATAGPVVIHDVEGDGEPEGTSDAEEPGEATPTTRRPFDPEMLHRNRAFWTDFRERVRFDDPDQPPPWRRPKPSPRSRVDGMAARIAGKRMHLWRAVDDGGEMLDVLAQRRRNRSATHKLLEKRGLGLRCYDLPRVAKGRGRQRVSARPTSTSSTITSSRSVRSAKSCGRSPPVLPADVPGLRALLSGVVAVATLHFGDEVLVTIGANRNPLGSAFQQSSRWRPTSRGRAPQRC